ncbi:unnamed protein product [Moneuplotes crassus]|uniref:Uncharacterized protein n=1 Tax=Euplotes crassus TaxID=5936 RepID=A0AAD1XUH5_EUPCR|nr:unnamed protein product [Moneuplotes crassus]
MFTFCKEWFKILQKYSQRECILNSIKQDLKDLKELSEKTSQERGNASPPDLHSTLDRTREQVLLKISGLKEDDEILYCNIKRCVNTFSKVFNFSIKFLNYPEYYYKSNRGITASPRSRSDLVRNSGKFNRRNHFPVRVTYKNSELFKNLFPSRNMLANDILRLKDNLSQI